MKRTELIIAAGFVSIFVAYYTYYRSVEQAKNATVNGPALIVASAAVQGVTSAIAKQRTLDAEVAAEFPERAAFLERRALSIGTQEIQPPRSDEHWWAGEGDGFSVWVFTRRTDLPFRTIIGIGVEPAVAVQVSLVCPTSRRDGDLNGDQLLDLNDWTEFDRCVGKIAPDADCSIQLLTCCDPNKDGLIDVVDSQILGERRRRSGECAE